jgi:hypothetical protein
LHSEHVGIFDGYENMVLKLLVHEVSLCNGRPCLDFDQVKNLRMGGQCQSTSNAGTLFLKLSGLLNLVDRVP